MDLNRNTVARILPGIAAGNIDEPFLPEVQNSSGSTYTLACAYKTRLDATDSDNETAESSVYTENGIKRIDLEFDSSEAFHGVVMGRGLYLGGGCLFYYDGRSVVESGFHLYPENFTLTSNGTGGLTASSSYSYRIYWEWLNALGEREQSSCAGVGTVSTGSNTAVDIVVQTLPFTLKTSTGTPSREEMHLAIYRTEADLSDLYYRVSSLDPASYTKNDPTADTISFTDTVADSALVDNELDYQNSGELDNIPPRAPSVLAAGKDRVFVAGGDIDGSEIYHSKIHNWVNAAEFNDSLVIKTDRAGGEITGLAVMNDNLIVFKEDRIYVVPGDGPDNLGFGSFGEPQQIATDVGCSAQKSIVLTPDGLMFKSDKGIYLLSQQLQLSYIGADVEAYNSQIFTAATMLPDTNQIIFLTDSGSTLMYDYHHRQWSTFTNHEGVGAAIWDDAYCYAKNDGYIYKRTDGLYLDGAAPYALRAVTSWIKFSGLQNFGRVKKALILGEFHTHHTIRMSIGLDYEAGYAGVKEFSTSGNLDDVAWGDAATWGADSYWGGSGNTVYQFQAFMPRQKCESVRFLFEDAQGDTPGQGYEITEIALLYRTKRSLYKLSSGRSV
jgi:hypothetical protein